jgi:diguanylate cyclase (GGDEF)-like protein
MDPADRPGRPQELHHPGARAPAATGEHELIVADLDRLRRLNEALGHERADLVLAALGSRLSAAFPPGALLARIGEDEFAALAPSVVSPGAEALRRRLEQPLRVAGFDIHPTLSIGAVEAPGGEDAPRPPSCCAAPSWPWRPPGPAAAAGRRLRRGLEATACRAWRWRAT